MSEEPFEIVQPKPEVEVEEKKTPSYFYEFLKDISYNKQGIFNDETKKDYSPYMVNRFLSMVESTVLYAQEMNLRPSIAPDMHYEYLMAAIRPSNRYFKYKKADKVHEDIILLSDYYQCSLIKAKEYFKIHTLDEIQEIQNRMKVGGSDVKTRRKKAKR